MSVPLAATPGLSAYRATAAGVPGAGLAPVDGAQGFAATLERALGDGVQSGRAAEAASVSALGGATGTTEVVMAVARAELVLQTAVALRDRVVAAYQDVMRMPI